VAPIVNRPVATIAEPMMRVQNTEYALGNLIADAQRAAARSDIAVMNSGGIRTGLAQGVATYGSLFEIMPFDNTLHRVTASGRAVRAYLEQLLDEQGRPDAHVSGARLTYDPARPAGQRILAVTVGGAPLRDDRTYTLVMNNFMATGRDGLALAAAAAKSEPLDLRVLDAVIDHLQAQRGPVRAPAVDRFVRVGR
jgi:5'-nucleotidase